MKPSHISTEEKKLATRLIGEHLERIKRQAEQWARSERYGPIFQEQVEQAETLHQKLVSWGQEGEHPLNTPVSSDGGETAPNVPPIGQKQARRRSKKQPARKAGWTL